MDTRLIAFDYDGVLADSLEHNLAVAAHVCASLGHARTATLADVERLENVSFTALGLELGMSPAMAAEFDRQCLANPDVATAQVGLFAGIPEAVQALAATCQLAVVSSNAAATVQPLLAAHGLQRFFQWILGAETAGNKADKLAALAAQLDVSRANVVMVGDGVSDIRAAKAAGVRSVAVTWGYHSRAKLERERPDHIVDTPVDLVRIFAD
ncbi:MAG: hypothetical protein A3K19_32835 [Lentisphaerae bacterium RIFOXYB12_FULL_65_16]|nr:MAG: hypothetical protein A3K18_20335 [Lentisphaerae bacterium RIFOXYA12_64_32]OGV84530.1 MAG: hypothetical protein A3K19_32835 [Lentisphaerae bacterium RIFOXYB12_FULL_65_16]